MEDEGSSNIMTTRTSSYSVNSRRTGSTLAPDSLKPWAKDKTVAIYPDLRPGSKQDQGPDVIGVPGQEFMDDTDGKLDLDQRLTSIYR